MDYNQRIAQFQKKLATAADLAFFPLSADLHYLTGVPRDTPNFGAVLHPGMWLEGVWIAPEHPPLLTLPRMTAEFGGLERVAGVEQRVLGDHDDPAKLIHEILQGFKLPPKPRIALGDSARAETAAALQALFPDAVFSSGTALLNPLRRIKSEDEIAIMRRAGEITEAAFQETVAQLQHGITELEVITELDYQLRAHGALGPSFATSLYCSGPNFPLMMGEREKRWLRPLNPPVAVLFDFGAVFEGYCYDFGRTVAFGDPDDEFVDIFALVMEAQAAGIAALKAGNATAAQADAAARAVIEAAGYGAEFRHRLGHSIGLDVHEAPFLTASDHTPLEAGMLFTVEPSIMQNAGFSARVEDVVVVRADGGEPLTSGFQKMLVVA